jgi:hypothetical protein
MVTPLSMVIVDKKRLPNAQAELRGLTISRRAAISSSLWLGSINKKRRISGAKLIDWDRI